MKVIIWGYPLHTHTHSYIHYGWYKGFSSIIGTHHIEEVYWFHDLDYPKNFNFDNCLFITEGYADKNIPINKTSTYFVHMCIAPEKYKNAKRLIDIRYLVKNIKDCNYWYEFNKEKCLKISDCSYYEKVNDNSGLTKFKNNPIQMNYEVLYTCWATDLLPNEFNLDNVNHLRKRIVNWIGTIGSSNIKEISRFRQACADKKIGFIHSDPWRSPKSFEENMKLVQDSYLAPDIRGSGDPSKRGENGTNHLETGYIPCRVLKSISYGCVGLTNSKAVKELLGDNVIYSENEYDLFRLGEEKMNDKEYLKKCMEYVRDHHTYINRINDLLFVFEKCNYDYQPEYNF